MRSPWTNAPVPEKEGKELAIAPETQKLNWKLNASPSTVDDREALKKLLTNPPVKKIDLRFPTGLEVPARNMNGVTIKDALDAIHKQMKKKVRSIPFPDASCPRARSASSNALCPSDGPPLAGVQFRFSHGRAYRVMSTFTMHVTALLVLVPFPLPRNS